MGQTVYYKARHFRCQIRSYLFVPIRFRLASSFPRPHFRFRVALPYFTSESKAFCPGKNKRFLSIVLPFWRKNRSFRHFFGNLTELKRGHPKMSVHLRPDSLIKIIFFLFIPVWHRICVFNAPFIAKADEHWSHLNGFSPIYWIISYKKRLLL